MSDNRIIFCRGQFIIIYYHGRNTTVRIGIESGAYFDADLDRPDLTGGFRRMKKHGYDCVDYQGFVHTETPLFQCSWNEWRGKLEAVRKCAEDEGIEIFQSHGPWRWPPEDETEEKRAERFEKMSKSLDGAAILGCPYLVIHPVMPYGWESDPEPRRLWEINIDFYSRLAEKAEQTGVTVCLENMPMPGISVASPAQILGLVREIGSPYLRVCLDTGHAVMFEDPAVSVRLLGREYLRTLHIHDNDGKRDLHLLPYCGVIKWEGFCRALRETGFDGVMSIETHAAAGMPPDLREYFEIGLAKTAAALAEMSGHGAETATV